MSFTNHAGEQVRRAGRPFELAQLRATHRLDQLLNFCYYGPRGLVRPWWQQLADGLANRLLSHPRRTEQQVWQYLQEQDLRNRQIDRQLKQLATSHPNGHYPLRVAAAQT